MFPREKRTMTLTHVITEITSETPFELVIIFAFVILCSLLARKLKQPAVMGCFIGGFIIHLLGSFTGIDITQNIPLQPHFIMVLIALLIYNEGLHLDFEQLKINKEEISLLSIGGTIIAIALCAYLLHLLLKIPLSVAVIAAAMFMPTDAGAVIAILNDMGVAPRWKSLISGESIFNDPFGLIIFGMALAVFSGIEISWGKTLALILIGSPIWGIFWGVLFYQIYKRLNDPISELLLSMMLFVIAFYGAELFHMSEFLAVAAASIFVGNKKDFCMDHETIETLERFWEAIAIAIEGFLFLMIGKAIPLEYLVQYLYLLPATILIVMVSRSFAVHTLLTIMDKIGQNVPLKWRIIVDLSGLHVGVTMAILLTLPDDLPRLAEIKAMGYYVIIWSVLVMPFLMKMAVKKMASSAKPLRDC